MVILKQLPFSTTTGNNLILDVAYPTSWELGLSSKEVSIKNHRGLHSLDGISP